jgi:hypothetical protein
MVQMLFKVHMKQKHYEIEFMKYCQYLYYDTHILWHRDSTFAPII